MTEKLYYQNAYIKEFSATVLSVTESDGRYCVILDRTAFFPEEGGQSSDRGAIGASMVLDVREIDGEIRHFCDTPPTVGTVLECRLDFEERFEKMQCHTAEHVICGIIHSLYGAENVGFHLSEDEVVFDVDAVLTREQLDGVRAIANRAVYENRPVTAYFPTKDELSSLEYRSKLELTENVRIVNIDGYDCCACCAPHVANTGEIGMIAILDFEKHRGGTRIHMLAGRRAERDYAERYAVSRRISALTSEPQRTVDLAVERLVGEMEELKGALKAAGLREAELNAKLLAPREGNAVVLLPELAIPELIAFSNSARKKVGGILVALSGAEKDYRYVISSDTTDLRTAAREINAALSGRGGGRSEMIQGSFSATLAEIEAFFK